MTQGVSLPLDLNPEGVLQNVSLTFGYLLMKISGVNWLNIKSNLFLFGRIT